MAVRVALALALMVVVVALNVAVVLFAATLIDAGTVSVELVLVSGTLTPPVGAGWVRVTVQVVEEFGPRLAGLQASEDISMTDVTRLTEAVAEVLL